ncbi:putative ATPase involved in DNA repair [Ahrensia sp. R2A130]|nr:putative ATPase involved in DNA repair [Ahrensia sp. R2A130]
MALLKVAAAANVRSIEPSTGTSFMLRLTIFASSILGLLTLQACQTLSKEECAVADWALIGERDGSAGRSLGYISKHIKACSKSGQPVDQPRWQEGHALGARRYCTPDNGLLVGNIGSTYNNICAADQQAGFLDGYNLGKERYALLQRRSSEVSNISTAKSGIDDINEKFAAGVRTQSDVIAERRKFRREIRQAKLDIDDLDFEIERLDRRISREGFSPPPAPAPVF